MSKKSKTDMRALQNLSRKIKYNPDELTTIEVAEALLEIAANQRLLASILAESTTDIPPGSHPKHRPILDKMVKRLKLQ